MPPQRVFTARDTGVSTMAWSAAQDREGILYFGCDTVVSFDGDRWRALRMEPTYLVRALDIGANGRIWAAGVNEIGWFEPGEQGRLDYHSLTGSLPKNSADLGDVWRVYAEGDQSALFVARDRVLRWDGRRFASWEYPGMHLLWSTRTSKSVYVHYPPVGLLSFGPRGPSLAVDASTLGSSEIRWLDDSGEDWLLLTSQGFKRLHGSGCTPIETGASSFVRDNIPTSAVRLRDGTLAVGTLNGGMALVDGEGAIKRILNTASGFPANQIYSLFSDRDGALWAMGPTYIARLAIGSNIAVYGSQNGYPPGGCDALAEDSGSVYVASHSDLLRLSPDPGTGGAGRFAGLGITSSRFYSLLSTPHGLAVGHSHGLGLWSPDGMRPLIHSGEIVFRTNPSLSRPGAILASLFDRVLSVNPLTGASVVVADSLPDYGDTVVDEPAGRLWIGTPSRGLFVAGPGATRAMPAAGRFGALPSAGTVLVTRVDSRIVALADTSAFILDEKRGQFRPLTGFPAASPLAVSNPDRRGAVWAAYAPSAGGRSPLFGTLVPAPAGAAWIPQSFEGISRVGTVVEMRVFRLHDEDELWIGGTEALLRVGPSAIAAHMRPKRPLIRAWIGPGGDRGAGAVAGILPYSTPGLHVEFSSLDFGMRESERIQTLLDGAETEWTPPTDSADRDISGLREGRYALKARLVTDSGAAGDPAEFRFEIAPPWWRTPFAWTAFAAVAALCVFGLLGLRTRALERRAGALEAIVRQRTEELEKANAAKSEFIANMSHEIRNPMGGILASALELSRAPLGPEERRLVATLRSCATFLASLVEDVLEFASLEARAYKITRSPFSPAEILGNVAVMLGPGSEGARIDAVVDPALPELLVGDSARVQQVIVNFALNSLKFGGRTIGLSARCDGDHVVFAVADDGCGIAEEEQKNLFLRFSRIKSARSSAVPGTGLGLAVTRVLAEGMGGAVGFSSTAGKGSTFFLRIPLEAARGPAPEPNPPGTLGARALVVEDIAYNARALGTMLGDLGFDVEFAENGESALERLSSAAFSFMFLDCDIPRIDGLEVARRFRKSEAPGKRIAILATTAYSAGEHREKCLAAGMDGCLTKPITPEKLRAALSALATATKSATGAGDMGSLDLRLVLQPTDGAKESRELKLAHFVAALDEALRGAIGAHASGSRTAVASAAHRVLSLARMVGAAALAETASDLQEYALVYTDAELAAEVGALCRHAAGLRRALAGNTGRAPLNPAWAS
ncbi:MAG: ATP-binding protein [Opitutaceae bacterium]